MGVAGFANPVTLVWGRAGVRGLAGLWERHVAQAASGVACAS